MFCIDKGFLMLKKNVFHHMTIPSGLALAILSATTVTHAEEQGWSVSGFVRGNYQYKEYAESEKSKAQISDVRLNLNYKKDQVDGKITARCVQFNEMCDLMTLSDAYLGYQLDEQQKVTVGLQPIPFGIGTYWDSSFYESMMYTIGMQETHNIGIRYDLSQDQQSWSFGYFPKDGGNYKGDSKDASRYSANFIEGVSDNATQIDEKNMLMMRYAYQGKKDTAGYTLGSSVWYSFLDNKNNNKTGSRMNANVFGQWATPTYDTTLTVGYQDIDNKQDGVAYSTFGSFDTEYHVANKAYYYVADIDYKTSWNYKDWKGFKPYLVFSGLMKQDGQPNSYRNIAGLQADYKNITINAEYILAKNDAFVGGNTNSFANSTNNDWKKLLYITFAYKF